MEVHGMDHLKQRHKECEIEKPIILSSLYFPHGHHCLLCYDYKESMSYWVLDIYFKKTAFTETELPLDKEAA